MQASIDHLPKPSAKVPELACKVGQGRVGAHAHTGAQRYCSCYARHPGLQEIPNPLNTCAWKQTFVPMHAASQGPSVGRFNQVINSVKFQPSGGLDAEQSIKATRGMGFDVEALNQKAKTAFSRVRWSHRQMGCLA